MSVRFRGGGVLESSDGNSPSLGSGDAIQTVQETTQTESRFSVVGVLFASGRRAAWGYGSTRGLLIS